MWVIGDLHVPTKEKAAVWMRLHADMASHWQSQLSEHLRRIAHRITTVEERQVMQLLHKGRDR
jgi:hypothetical protein